MKNGIDLHTDSARSDGSMEPGELVRKAVEIGLKTIALTDHDTVAGIEEALFTAEQTDVEVIPGIEISAFDNIEYHVLGYFNRYSYKLIEPYSIALREKRNERNPKIVKKLRDFGYDITMEDVLRQGEPGAVIGRLHIAKALVEKGITASISEAFAEFLAEGKKAYVPRERLTPEESVALIRKCGGVPVLAHPKFLHLNKTQLTAFLENMKKVGLMGLEVYYTENTKEETEYFEKLAEELGLLKTGGSDYHGENKENQVLGSGVTDIETGEEIVANLKKFLSL